MQSITYNFTDTIASKIDFWILNVTSLASNFVLFMTITKKLKIIFNSLLEVTVHVKSINPIIRLDGKLNYLQFFLFKINWKATREEKLWPELNIQDQSLLVIYTF